MFVLLPVVVIATRIVKTFCIFLMSETGDFVPELAHALAPAVLRHAKLQAISLGLNRPARCAVTHRHDISAVARTASIKHEG